jgi:hypothetical protein
MIGISAAVNHMRESRKTRATTMKQGITNDHRKPKKNDSSIQGSGSYISPDIRKRCGGEMSGIIFHGAYDDIDQIGP